MNMQTIDPKRFRSVMVCPPSSPKLGRCFSQKPAGCETVETVDWKNP